MHLESAVSAGLFLTLVFAEPGLHGATITGTHGTGLPDAATTAGLVGAEHMPNVGRLVTEKSWIVATVMLVPLTMLGTSVSDAGSVPKEHFAWAPITTSCGTLSPRTAAIGRTRVSVTGARAARCDGAQPLPHRARGSRRARDA